MFLSVFRKILAARFIFYRHLGRLRIKLKARRTNKVFACLALQGDSDYNICINSDLSISCNCQDYDGSGRLGSLSRQSFAEIFFGPEAQAFRQSLSRGQFPVSTCWICSDFLLVDKAVAGKYLSEPKLPAKGVMVENTVLCNLACLGCDREQLAKTRTCKSLPRDGIENIARDLSEMQVGKISFFNLGEPFLSRNVCHEIATLRRHNPVARISTSTNGCCLDTQEKKRHALLLDHIYFSIDGCDQETLGRYQINGDFEKAYGNMRDLVNIRNNHKVLHPLIEWKYVLFRWNDHPRHIIKAIDLAKLAGVDIISFWPGGAPITYRSFRYQYHPFYKRLGYKCWKGREIDLRHQREIKGC